MLGKGVAQTCRLGTEGARLCNRPSKFLLLPHEPIGGIGENPFTLQNSPSAIPSTVK